MAKVVVTGLNGYGGNFVRELLKDTHNELIAVISGSPQKSPYYEELLSREISVYPTIESCLEQKIPDMVIICTPAHIHYREVMACLNKGVSVYCEKPLTTTLEKTLAIKKLAKEKGLTVAVGFQWSYSEGIQNLKQDILNNKYGKITNIKTLANFVRPIHYYANSSWKGKNLDASGEVIFDNVLSNVTAHYMHNMLFLAGAEMTKALDVTEGVDYDVTCYRAHNIEGFDTIILKLTKGHLQIGLYGTLVAQNTSPVEFMLEGEKGKIVYPYDEEEHIAAIDADGIVTLYGRPDNNRFTHYQEVIAAMEAGSPAVCDVETVEPFQRVVEYVRQHMDVQSFHPEDVIVTEDNVFVRGISERLRKAYDEETFTRK